MRAPRRSGSLQIFGVLWPALAVLVAAPITLAAMSAGIKDTWLMAPTIMGFLAAPGYLRGLVGWISLPALPTAERWWVRASFALALAASVLGAWVSLVFIVPAVAAAFTAGTLVVVWRRLERAPEG